MQKTLWLTLALTASVLMQAPAVAQLSGTGESPRVDPDMRTVLDKLGELGVQPVEQLSVEQARRQPTPADAVNALKTGSAGVAAEVERREITYAAGAGPLRAKVYLPRQRDLALSDAQPVIIYFHGGGWVIASVDAYDGSAAALAAQTPAIVVSFEYRLAPEHPLPAAHEDAYAALKWTVENATALGGDPRRLALAGESAGGNLATYVAFRARDEGIEGVRHLALIYPVASASMALPSYSIHADAKPLSRAGMEWFLAKAVQSDEARRIVELLKTNLAGLPPTTIINAEIDPLLSDGQELASALRRANVDVRHRKYDGVTHEFFGMTPVVGDAKSAQEFMASRLKESFGDPRGAVPRPLRR